MTFKEKPPKRFLLNKFVSEKKSIMSFQFSQNLLADLQSLSPNSSQSQPTTQQALPPSQNSSQPLMSQSQTSIPSQNLLMNQSQDYHFPLPQNIKPRVKFPRSKSSQSLSLQQQQPLEEEIDDNEEPVLAAVEALVMMKKADSMKSSPKKTDSAKPSRIISTKLDRSLKLDPGQSVSVKLDRSSKLSPGVLEATGIFKK